MNTKTGGDIDPSQEEDSGNVIEVGSQAVWSLSSCKPGTFELIYYHTNSMTVTVNSKIMKF